MSDDETIKRIKENIKASEEEKVTKLIFNDKEETKKLSLELSSKITESSVLNDKKISVNLSQNAINLLKTMVTESNVQLISIANEYQKSGREFYSFLYDCVSLSWYLSNLPKKFERLIQNFSNAGDLMHNRVQAEIAFAYFKLGNSVDLEISTKKGSKPDLNLDGIDVEVKTIVSIGENTQESFKDFTRRLRTRHDEEALEQIDKNGMVFVSMWSHVMNNVLKEYFTGRYSSEIPILEKGKSVLVLEGKKALVDYYSVFDSKGFSSEIEEFALSGYKRISQMAYLGDMRRSGFPIERSGNASDVLNKGFVIKVG